MTKEKEPKDESLKNITNAIMQYINMTTDYSVMLNGPWGSGKTFFVRNTLFDKIKVKKPYRPVYISLFGVNSLDDLTNKLIIETLPFFINNEAVKITGAFGKLALRGILQSYKLGNVDDYLGDFNKIVKKLSDLDRLVIIFDDLERKGDIGWKELTGFINNLVEGETNKAILVANEEEINANEFNDLKDKLVRTDLSFQPEFMYVAQQIIKKRYKKDHKKYSHFLKDNLTVIEKVFITQAKCYNLRHLSFALEMFGDIYYELTEDSARYKGGESVDQKAELQSLFSFLLAISIEFRGGKLTATDTKGIDVAKSSTHLLSNKFILAGGNSQDIDEPDDYDYYFLKKYYWDDEYKFYESVYDFVTGKSGLNLNKLEGELNNKFTLPKKSQEQKDYSLATSFGYNDLSNEEFSGFFYRLLTSTESGKYSPANTVNISSYIWHMNENILGQNGEAIIDTMKVGINKSIQYYGNDDSIKLMFGSSSLNAGGKAIYEEALALNEKYKEQENIEYEKELNHLARESFPYFISKLDSDEFTQDPILSRLNVESFFSGFKNTVDQGDNQSLNYSVTVLKKRRERFREEESDFRLELAKAVRAEFDLEKKNLTTAMLKNLVAYLEQ